MSSHCDQSPTCSRAFSQYTSPKSMPTYNRIVYANCSGSPIVLRSDGTRIVSSALCPGFHDGKLRVAVTIAMVFPEPCSGSNPVVGFGLARVGAVGTTTGCIACRCHRYPRTNPMFIVITNNALRLMVHHECTAAWANNAMGGLACAS